MDDEVCGIKVIPTQMDLVDDRATSNGLPTGSRKDLDVRSNIYNCKIMNNEEAGTYGLETLTTETFAMDQETTISEQATSTDFEYILPLQAASVRCEACSCQNKNVLFFAFWALDRHIKEE